MNVRKRFSRFAITAVVALSGFGIAASAQAMTAQECYNNFRAEKKVGNVGGMDYTSFKASKCDITTAKSTTKKDKSAAQTATATPAVQQPVPATTTPTTGPTSAAQGNAVFPTGVAAQYASLKPGRARMQTCLDQYRVNKSSNRNGGLRWIQKGGGYYSECNKRLKQ